MDTSTDKLASSPWWRPLEAGVGEGWQLAIGPLTLFIQRLSDQWMVASRRTEGTQEPDVFSIVRTVSVPEDLNPARFVFRQTSSRLELRPKLLDRSMVVRTSHPVRVPPGESITFYISSPVCVSVMLPDQQIELQELMTMRLSDTWFGPSTQLGSLCYAARTLARMSRNEVPPRAHRAVTPVTITNQAVGFLAIDKISIPLPHLAVYANDQHALWTDPVELTHVQGNPLTNFTVGKPVAGHQQLSPARVNLPKGGLVRAFAHIFHT